MLQFVLLCVAVVVLVDTQSSPETCGVAWGQAYRACTFTSTHSRTPRINAPSSNRMVRTSKDTETGSLLVLLLGIQKTSGGLVLMKTSRPEMKVVKMTKTMDSCRPRGRLTEYKTSKKLANHVVCLRVRQCLEPQRKQRETTEKEKIHKEIKKETYL